MKKLLTLLAAVGLTTATSNGVIACKGSILKNLEVDSDLAIAVRNYLISDNVLGHTDVLLAEKNSEQIKLLSEKIIDLLKAKENLKLDFEGESVEIKVASFVLVDGQIIVEVNKENTKKTIGFSLENIPALNFVEVNKLNGSEMIRTNTEISAKKFSIKKELNLNSNYESEIFFESNAMISGSGKGVQKVSGKVTVGAEFISSSAEFDLEINLINSIDTLAALVKSAWSSNTYANGLTTYDWAVYGLMPSSLHDAIALHTGDSLTGKYLFKSGSGFALYDAKTEQQVTNFKEDDYQWLVNNSGRLYEFDNTKYAIDKFKSNNGMSFIYGGILAIQLAEGGIEALMKRADNAQTIEEAKDIGIVGDAFNWERRLSAAHCFADYFNKYVHQGEKTNPLDDTTTIYVKNKEFSVTQGSKTSTYTIIAVDPKINDPETIGYYGYKDQGLIFTVIMQPMKCNTWKCPWINSLNLINYMQTLLQWF
ncbi:hypothetical protein SCLARK_00280 [Spiroplasma clarkii]|uniref:Uncharacterized protein n=1 Tax=Spiroplasma clarkii TaxID=2139 RepID=A0A1Y0KZ84_9MOLU|nr:lipoprotein [Spiroplasma clarkii]ARU91037.1 hypothetical protein SCLARK_00280 [Spiroplasma clarkii]ATX70475.1 hypothetical protein SCLAR_v1c01440 [Spiroplasma clarkii]